MRLKVKENYRGGESALDTVIFTFRDTLLKTADELEHEQSGGIYSEYQGRPVEFCEEILHERLTPDVKKLMRTFMDNPITFARSANGTGKTHAAARLVVFCYKCYKGSKVYTAAAPPEENLKRILWPEIGRIVENNPALFSDDQVSLASMHIQRSPDEFITGVTIPQAGDPALRKAKFSGKHAPFLWFFLDEADAIPADILEAIESCMSGGFARLMCFFNPRSQMGPMYMMEKNDEAVVVELSAFTHPNVITGEDIIPGAVTKNVTVARIMKWTRPLLPGEKIGSDCFKVPEFLVGFKAAKNAKGELFPPLPNGFRRIIEPAFSYMVLGVYSSQTENQLVSRADIEKCNERWEEWVNLNGEVPPISVKPSIGLDVADMGNDTSVATPKYEWFIATQRIWAKMELPDLVDELNKLALEIGCEDWYVDSNGLGTAVPPLLERLGWVAHRILPMHGTTEDAKDKYGEVIGQFERMRDQGFYSMANWIKNEPKAAFPPDKELVDELLAITYGKNPRTGRIKICDNDVMKVRLGGRSPDKASSFMQLFCDPQIEDGATEAHQDNYAY